MIKHLNNLILKYCLKKFPQQTKIIEEKVTTILVKKGKIREWRTYDKDHNRIELKK